MKIGFGLVYALIACVGAIGSIAVTDMTGVYSTDPAEWITTIGGLPAVLCLLCLIASNISVMAVAMYSLSVSTKVIKPEWKYKTIVILWSKGFNMAGAAAFVCGTIAYFAVYDPIAGVGRNFLFDIFTGTGASCITAAVVYYGLSKIPKIRAYLLKDKAK